MGNSIFELQDKFAIHSPFKKRQTTELNYKDKIERLLNANNLTGFIYTNTIKGITGNDVAISVYGRMINSKLDLRFSSNAFMLDMNPDMVTGLTILNDSMRYLVVQTKNDGWELYDRKIDPRFITRNWTDISSRNPMTTSEEENRQIYYEFIDAGFKENTDNLSQEFNSICSKINTQLSNKFYSGTQIFVYVKRVDEYGKTIIGQENTLKTKYDDSPYEVKLNITIKADGTVEIKHVLSDKYLQEYVKYWEKEAKARGIDVNINDLRKQVIQDFESVEIEKTFYQKFIQNAKSVLSDKIAGYVEGVQATQKIAKNVWEVGTINESTWYSKNEKEYKQWPQYIHTEPVIGGAIDGVIDEIVGIPVAIKGVYGIVTDAKQRQAIKGMFSKDGASKLLDGLKEEVKEIKKDSEKLDHFVGHATVAVAAIVTGYSIFSKGGKLAEVLDKTTDGIKKFLNPKVVKLFDDIKNIFRYQPEGRKAFESVIKNETQEAVEAIAEEILTDKKLYEEVTKNPVRWALGKLFEKSISDRFKKELIEHTEFLTEFAEKAATTVDELKLMTRVEQLQIHLPGGGFTIIDDAFVKTTKVGKTTTYEVILNETKLSKLAPFTTNQEKLIEALEKGTTDFVIRSKTSKITDVITANSTITIKSYVKTVGEGVDDATKYAFEKIK